MKKILAVLLIMLSLFSLAADYAHVKSTSFKVQAGFGEMSEVYITEIPAQSSQFLEGMPFNIEDSIVQFSNGGRGRTIAYFSVMSNTNCKIGVKAENLEWQDGPEDSSAGSASSEGLSYILNFDYNVSYTTADGSIEYSPNDTGFIVHSGQSGEGASLYTGQIPSNTYLSISDGRISFMFDSETSDRIRNNPDSVPAGIYTGTVVITLEDLT